MELQLKRCIECITDANSTFHDQSKDIFSSARKLHDKKDPFQQI